MHVILWEFRIKAGREKEFEKLYSPEGAWAALFRSEEGYLATELWLDPADPRRYLTLDRWMSREAYESFRRRRIAEYQALDALGEELTEREDHLGSFELKEPAAS